MSDAIATDQHGCTIEVAMQSTPEAIYEAWTEHFDTWFASPGALSMDARVGQPYWFEVEHNGARHPHYGRFLALEPGRLITQTWVTGPRGTDGAETVVTVTLTPAGEGTRLLLTHTGFLGADAAPGHADSWPGILRHLDEVIAASQT